MCSVQKDIQSRPHFQAGSWRTYRIIRLQAMSVFNVINRRKMCSTFTPSVGSCCWSRVFPSLDDRLRVTVFFAHLLVSLPSSSFVIKTSSTEKQAALASQQFARSPLRNIQAACRSLLNQCISSSWCCYFTHETCTARRSITVVTIPTVYCRTMLLRRRLPYVRVVVLHI